MKVKPKKINEEERFDLDCTIANFVVPRLEAFIRDYKNSDCIGLPCELNSKEEWLEVLNKILYFFKAYQPRSTSDNEALIKEGGELFVKYIGALWE